MTALKVGERSQGRSVAGWTKFEAPVNLLDVISRWGPCLPDCGADKDSASWIKKGDRKAGEEKST